MFAKIIVGLDGSEQSLRALNVGCDLAGKYGSELHLVHSPQPQTVAFAMGAVAGYHMVTTLPSQEEVQEAADKIFDAAKAVAEEAGQSVTETHMRLGEPADHIIEVAKDTGADLIVTGRRGLGSMGSLLQGSTTQRVNHLADCACLSVL